MKFLTLILFGIIFLVAITEAIVCRKDYCKHVTCPTNFEEICKEHIVPHTSFCGCCPTCVTYIEPNGDCVKLRIRGGIPATFQRKCAPGYSCINSKCQKSD